MKGYFIAGTDTNIGKTVVSAVLTLALKACYWKPIQTGLADDLPESVTVQQLTGLSNAHFLPSVYQLQASLAGDQAAELENVVIDLSKCSLPTVSETLIVEGGGGVFNPVNKSETMMDLIEKLQLPVIIVSRGTLGTINHTLLTIEALRRRDIVIQGVIFSGELMPKNQYAIEQKGNVNTLLHVPYFKNLTNQILQDWTMSQQQNIISRLA